MHQAKTSHISLRGAFFEDRSPLGPHHRLLAAFELSENRHALIPKAPNLFSAAHTPDVYFNVHLPEIPAQMA